MKRKILAVLAAVTLAASPAYADTETEMRYERDTYLLAHLIAGECQCYSRKCQLYTGSVVLNRVASSHYPDTIEKVIFQKGQYACTWDGNFDREPTATNWEVAEYLMENGSQLPADVIYQSRAKQGKYVYDKVDGEYFCGGYK